MGFYRDADMSELVWHQCIDCGENTKIGKPGRKRVVRCIYCKITHIDKERKRRSGASRLKKQLLKKRDNFCEICKKSKQVQMHHLDSKGATCETNCILVCVKCHKSLHGNRGVGPKPALEEQGL